MVDPVSEIKSRIAARKTTIETLQVQVARNEQFGNELRGKLFTAQAQHAELNEILTAFESLAVTQENPHNAQLSTLPEPTGTLRDWLRRWRFWDRV